MSQTPSFRLDGRRAAVTGAGRGLGLAMARALAEAGAEVTLLARSAGEIETAAEAIRAAGGQAQAVALDVTDLAAVRGFFDARPAFHALVNNAGSARHGSFLEVDEADFDAVFALNVRAAFFTAQAAARRMAAEGVAGSIVNVSSQMGHVGGPERSVYCASKHAMEGFTKAMAVDFAGSGLRANTLCPTFVVTPLTAPFFESPEFVEFVGRRMPMGKPATPQDVAAAAVFLCSDGSRMMTGSALKVDGGWTAG
ncbi:SDR family oxidoreductase [uncultured Albimonas sp.]|uniref:SDR family NAD(P)-dependent oxidoreductase n=1 Tax=uncultured Albimonas sp. TaxID=1331701 RepID=UPI0030EC4EDB|tara:strand:- start:1361 stop:2119 length:759 start_codon:yes stop_codon:yes gene_type:complete